MAETESLTFTVSEAARVLGISRTTAYECVRTGELRAVRLGRRLVVPKVAIVELLAGSISPTPSPPATRPPLRSTWPRPGQPQAVSPSTAVLTPPPQL